MKNKKKYHSVGTVPKFYRAMIERGKIETLNTHIHKRSLLLLGIDTRRD